MMGKEMIGGWRERGLVGGMDPADVAKHGMFHFETN